MFRKKKKKLENNLTLEEMQENFNVFTYERERLHAQQVQLAMELSQKRRVADYVR